VDGSSGMKALMTPIETQLRPSTRHGQTRSGAAAGGAVAGAGADTDADAGAGAPFSAWGVGGSAMGRT
jgi:hypothetical protein